MRLPWVSRDVHDRCMASYGNDLNAAIGREQHAERRYDALLEKYDALVDRLLNPKVALAPSPQPAPEKKDSVIAKTIRAEAGGDPRLAAHFWKRCKEIKTEHPDWEDSQVADELAKWDSTFVEAHAP